MLAAVSKLSHGGTPTFLDAREWYLQVYTKSGRIFYEPLLIKFMCSLIPQSESHKKDNCHNVYYFIDWNTERTFAFLSDLSFDFGV